MDLRGELTFCRLNSVDIFVATMGGRGTTHAAHYFWRALPFQCHYRHWSLRQHNISSYCHETGNHGGSWQVKKRRDSSLDCGVLWMVKNAIKIMKYLSYFQEKLSHVSLDCKLFSRMRGMSSCNCHISTIQKTPFSLKQRKAERKTSQCWTRCLTDRGSLGSAVQERPQHDCWAKCSQHEKKTSGVPV